MQQIFFGKRFFQIFLSWDFFASCDYNKDISLFYDACMTCKIGTNL